MEYYDSVKKKEEWGKKACDHPEIEKMYYAGAFLTVYGCTVCGAELSISEMLEKKEQAAIARQQAG